jgi:transcriptional regulator with XRE-family HTH domain
MVLVMPNHCSVPMNDAATELSVPQSISQPMPQAIPPEVSLAGHSLGDLLRSLRRQADLSQRQLAELAGVPPSTVARIESGVAQDPRFRTLERLVQAVGATFVVGAAVSAGMRPGGRERARQDPAGGGVSTEAGPPEAPELVDAAGRRYPAHLDVREVREPRDWSGAWWAQWYTIPPERWPVAMPAVTYDLDRGQRDRLRRRSRASAGVAVRPVGGLPAGQWQLQAVNSAGDVVGEIRAYLGRPFGASAAAHLAVDDADELHEGQHPDQGQHTDRTRHEAVLDGVVVRPDCRLAGVGRQLVDALITELLRAEVAVVHVTSETPLIDRFWQHCGFRPVSRAFRWGRALG